MLPIVIGLCKTTLNLRRIYKLNFSILLEEWEIFKYLFLVKNVIQNRTQKRVLDTPGKYILLYFWKRAWKAQTLHAITSYGHYIFPNAYNKIMY